MYRLSIQLQRRKSSLNLVKIDHVAKQKRNEKIGEQGELFVYEYEKKKVATYCLKDKCVEWVSKTKGDGLGYDILSYDESGKEMFIEVKTTKGKETSDFYITNTELSRSVVDSDNFYLYRVYDFDVKQLMGKISYHTGSLESLCISPLVFSVHLDSTDKNEI